MTSQQNYRQESFVSGLFGKAPVQVATTANITLSGEQTVNTVALLEGNRCLVKDQTDPVENGIYTVEQSAWQRAGDFDGSRDVVLGTMIMVELPAGAVFEVYVVTAVGSIGVDAVTVAPYLTSNATLDLQAVTDNGAISTLGLDILEVIMNEQVSGANPGAGKGRIFLKDTVPTTVWFKNDIGGEIQLGGGTGISNVIEDLTPDLGGPLGCGDNEVRRPILVDYAIKSTSASSAAGILTLNLAVANSFEVTLTENITSIVIQNPSPTGNYCELDIVFTQDATGSWTVTGYPAGTKWAGGTEPTITTTATTGEDEVHMSTRNAGTKYLATIAQDFS